MRKKKDSNKKKSAKKKGTKKKGAKNKRTRIAEAKKKKSTKIESPQNESVVETDQEGAKIAEMHTVQKQETEIEKIGDQVHKLESSVVDEADSSLKYNVQDAVKKLKELESMEEVMAFTKGDQRVTVTRAKSALQNSFETR